MVDESRLSGVSPFAGIAVSCVFARLLLISDSDFILRIGNPDCTVVIVIWKALFTFFQHRLTEFGAEILDLAIVHTD